MGETKYLVIKRIECDHDERYLTLEGCRTCGVKGYTDAEVDLADAIRDIFSKDISFNLKIQQALSEL